MKTVRYTRSHKDRCQEAAVYQSGLVLDKTKGLVHGVKFLGFDSLHKRKYKATAVKNALPQYDQVLVNLNHADNDGSFKKPRVAVQDRFGRLIDPEVRADGGYATLKYNTKHSWAPAFEWFVENDAEAIGLSHDAILLGPFDNEGNRTIESIPKVFSVDIVADPGSTHGMFEDASGEEPKTDTGAISMDDVNAGEENGTDDHLVGAITEIAKDAMLSCDEKLKKIKALLEMMHDGDDEPGEAETPEPEESDDMSKENEGAEGLQAELEKLRLENEAFRAKEDAAVKTAKAKLLCEKADLDEKLITKTFLGQMTRSQESEWEDLISDRRLQGTSAPKSQERGNTEVKFDDFVKFMGAGK